MKLTEIQQLLYNECRNSASHANFILSHIDTMACFSTLPSLYHGIFAVTDTHFIPFYYMETTAYIHCCGISNNGNYAIFRTANSPYEDSNKAFFINVQSKTILWKKDLKTSFKSIESFFIDTTKQTITEVHRDYNAIFSFEGDFLNELQWIEKRYKHTDCDPYELLTIALNIFNSITDINIQKNNLKLAIKYLKIAEETPNTSTYQLSLAYHQLGDLYFKFIDGANALKYYKKALALNPNLPIKRTIKILETSLGKNNNKPISAKEKKKEKPIDSKPKKSEYLHTKWGIYEMPEPYTLSLTKGLRNDLTQV